MTSEASSYGSATNSTTASRHGRDALFELADAALCVPGPLRSVPALSLEPEFRRSHGSLYKALANGAIDTDRFDRLLVVHRPADWPNRVRRRCHGVGPLRRRDQP